VKKKNKKNQKLEGIFIANEKGYGFIEVEDDEKEDFFVPSKSTNGALDGDVVQFVMYKQKTNDRRAEAKVVKILRREKETVVGVFQKSKNFGFVVPDDKRFQTDIFISKKNSKNAKNLDKVVVKIIKYPTSTKNAEGEVIEILGGIDEAGVDMLSVIKEFNLPNEFPKEVLEEARSIPQRIYKRILMVDVT